MRRSSRIALALIAPVTIWLAAARRADAQPAPGWELRIPERVELVAGAGGTLPIALAVDRGFSISKDAGTVVDLAPEGAVSIKKRRLGRNDAVDPDADAPRFSVALRADTAGDFTIKVKLRFWVCGRKVCKPAEARRTVAIAVTAAP